MSAYVPTASDIATAPETTRGARKPPVRGGPVLMADCITPAGGETLLSLLWKRWDAERAD